MGLDQYAYLRERNQMPDDADESGEQFYWRKHARLQMFMEKQYNKLNGGRPHGGMFNCVELPLNEEQLLELQEAINTKYYDHFCDGGFFYGHQFQEQSVEEYKEQDNKFVDQALAHIKAGGDVIYLCSW